MLMDESQTRTPTKYADERVLLLNNELKKYAVSIVPILPDMQNLDPSAMGSGTCVRIGGRYFIATAAHVIMGRRFNQNFVLTPKLSNWSLRIVGGNVRGGGQGEYLDIGWLELHGRAAALSERSWLDVARLRTHCVGDEDLVVFGSPQSAAERQTHPDGSPMLHANSGWWATRGITDARDLASEDRLGESKMFLKWPRRVKGHNDEYYEYPDAPGISGGSVWAVNLGHKPWRAEYAQLVGIEYAWARVGVPDRYVKALQIQTWLEMLADDVPELRSTIAPVIAAGRVPLIGSKVEDS